MVCPAGEAARCGRRPGGRQWLWWILTALWAAEIFGASTSGFNSYRTASALAALLKQVHLEVSPELLSLTNTIIRKGAHVVEYAILTALLYRAASGMGALAGRFPVARWCIVAAVAYSLTDECHQLFVPGRGASIVDCCFDGAGSALAMLVLRRNRRLPAETGHRAP